MKILFVGLGSIGQRHLRNLQKIGDFSYYAFRNRNLPLPAELQNIHIETIESLSQIEALGIDFAIIAAPPSVQEKVLFDIVESGIDFFVEKPIGIKYEVVAAIAALAKEKQLISMVGYNLRFHPVVQKVKEILDKNKLGNIASIRVSVGQYLPDWHPHEDYRQGYSANRSLGGGAILDLIHEIDLAYSLFGTVADVLCFKAKSSHLEIDTEDVAEMLIKFESGIIASIHTDYICRAGHRKGMIIGDGGSLEYDLLENSIVLKIANQNIQRMSFEFERNDMYLNEMKLFISSVHNRVLPDSNIHAGLDVLKIANQAHLK
jgi:predicted dehydrogenase